MRILPLVILAAVASGCAAFPKAEVPMPAMWHRDHGPEQARGLLVLLPGLGDAPGDWSKRGVVDDARALLPGFDIVMPEAHFGYYRDGQVIERLEQDIVGPARAEGYDSVWFLGVSMGGLGAAAYAAHHPGEVDGVVLIAPFLGESHVAQSVFEAESLGTWDPAGVETPDDRSRFFLTTWKWLQANAQAANAQADCAIYLGYGDQDGPGTADQRLADALPGSRFFERPGGHTWAVWNPMIREMLPGVDRAAGVLARARAAGRAVERARGQPASTAAPATVGGSGQE